MNVLVQPTKIYLNFEQNFFNFQADKSRCYGKKYFVGPQLKGKDEYCYVKFASF